MRPQPAVHRRAVVLMMLIVSLAVVGALTVGMVRMFVARQQMQLSQERHLQAAMLAQSGVERAAAQLQTDAEYVGETWEVSAEQLAGRQAAQVRIAANRAEGDAEVFLITSQASVGDDEFAVKYTRTAEFELPSP